MFSFFSDKVWFYIFRTYNSAMCFGIFKYKELIVVPSQLHINVGLVQKHKEEMMIFILILS